MQCREGDGGHRGRGSANLLGLPMQRGVPFRSIISASECYKNLFQRGLWVGAGTGREMGIGAARAGRFRPARTLKIAE